MAMSSWMDRYQGETKNTIDYLRYYRLDDPVKSRELLHQLIKTGEAEHDPALLGFAHFYLSQIAYFVDTDISVSLQEAAIAIRYLENADAPFTLANCYDLLASLCFHNDMYEAAAEYLLKGISLCGKIDFLYEQANMTSILADLYASVAAYGKAEELLQKSSRLFEQAKEDPLVIIADINWRILNNRISLLNCRVNDGRMDQIETEINELRAEIEKLPHGDVCMTLYYSLCFNYACKTGKQAEATECLEKLIPSLSLDKEMIEVGFALIPVLQMVYASENKTWIQMADPLADKLITRGTTYSLKMKLLLSRWNSIRADHPEAAADLMNQMAELSAAKDRQEQEWNLLQIEETVSMYEANQKADEWMDQAIHDELTSLTNRRGFEQYFQARTSIIAREKKPFAIGMMDVDHFKEYNDHNGHVAGDMVLQNVAEVLASCQQDNLIAARYGGDEFCFFAYDIDQPALEKILQEFQQKIRDLHIRHEYGGKDGMVSVSCGAAFYAGSDGQPELQACFEDADHVLYQIKRNRQGSFAVSRCTLKVFEK